MFSLTTFFNQTGPLAGLIKKKAGLAVPTIVNFHLTLDLVSFQNFYPNDMHSGPKVLFMPMFQRVGMKVGGGPLPVAFQYLIPMI